MLDGWEELIVIVSVLMLDFKIVLECFDDGGV